MNTRASWPTGVVFRPPNGALLLQRVQVGLARHRQRGQRGAAGDVGGLTCSRMRAQPGGGLGACHQLRQARQQIALALLRRAGFQLIERCEVSAMLTSFELCQPALAAAVELHVAEALAARAGHAEVELFTSSLQDRSLAAPSITTRPFSRM
jgi:hypothetical protein